MNRRELIIKTIPSFAALSMIPSLPGIRELSDEDLLAQAALLRELDNDAYGWIWSILRGITDEELDWKIHAEANSIRWIIGHLIWFEEWAGDAIEEKGLYLIDEQPSNSFQSEDLQEMKDRFSKARERYKALTEQLDASQISRPAEYLFNDHDQKRAQVDLRTIIAIHSTHFYGHLYQIRMIRGTYSRAHSTDKAEFDKW